MSKRNTAKSDPFLIRSAADLEIVVLYEAHGLLADIVSSFLYRVSGPTQQQQAVFHSGETFELFSIRVGEFLTEAGQTVAVDGAPPNLSLLSGLEWAASRLAEPGACDLRRRLDALRAWLDTKDQSRFWCGGLDAHLQVEAERGQFWKTHANLCKHTPFRLHAVMEKLQRWTLTSGYPLAGTDVLEALDAFAEWLTGYAEYHATMMAELLGGVFFSLNRVVWERWEANGRSNDSRRIAHPSGTSPVFENLHTGLLVFRRYDDARIADLTPSTTKHLWGPYAIGLPPE